MVCLLRTVICNNVKKNLEKKTTGPLSVSATLSLAQKKILISILYYRSNEKIQTSTVCNTTGWGWTHPIFQERPSVLHLAQIPIHNRHVHVLSSQFYPDTKDGFFSESVIIFSNLPIS